MARTIQLRVDDLLQMTRTTLMSQGLGWSDATADRSGERRDLVLSAYPKYLSETMTFTVTVCFQPDVIAELSRKDLVAKYVFFISGFLSQKWELARSRGKIK